MAKPWESTAEDTTLSCSLFSSLEEEVRGQGCLLLPLQEEVDKSLFSLYKKAEGETLYSVETRTKLSPPLEKRDTVQGHRFLSLEEKRTTSSSSLYSP